MTSTAVRTGRVLMRRLCRRVSDAGSSPKDSPPVVHYTTGALHMGWGGEELSEYVATVELAPFVLDAYCTERHAFSTLVVSDRVVLFLKR